MKKLDYVDALRGVAILLVISNHVGLACSRGFWAFSAALYGQYGVQLFFVVSAFTLCRSLERSPRLTPTLYGTFMVRRFFRIAPMYYFGMLIYLGAWTPLSGYTWAKVLTNLTFLNGLYPAGNNTIVPGGWSIGCEFLFYLIFPFLLFASRARPWLVLALVGASLASMAGFVIVARLARFQYYSGNNSFVYFSGVNQAPCFLLGMAYYYYGGKSPFRISIYLLLPLCILGLVFAQGTHFGWLITPLCSGVCAVALSQAMEGRAIPSILRRFGILSFSMYILHFLFVGMLSHLLGPPGSNSEAFVFLILTILATVAGAYVSNAVIEAYFIRLGQELTRTYSFAPVGSQHSGSIRPVA